MNKRSRVVFTSFGRLERLLFWQILAEGSMEVIGIVSEASPAVIAEFFEFDSNHGQLVDYKITVNDNDNNKNVVLVGNKSASVQIIPAKKFSKKFCVEKGVDILVNLSEQTSDALVEKYAGYDAKANIFAANSQINLKKGMSFTAFGINHKSINLSKKRVLIVPKVEAMIAALLTQMVQKYVLVSSFHFTALKGPNYASTCFDQITHLNEEWKYSRASINNIVPGDSELISKNIDQLLHELKMPIITFGEVVHTPVTSAGLINFLFRSKKNVKRNELIKVLREESDDVIGFSKTGLVAQDATSTSHLAIIDEKLTKCLAAKDYSTLKVGVWFDYESSFIRNFFELMLYISGLPELS